jgi:hypothetical protein
MTLEQALLKIIQLQDEIASLKAVLHESNSKISLTDVLHTKTTEFPYTIKKIDEKSWDCQHEYPNPWFGVIPPSCKKCGQLSQMLTVTCDTKLSTDSIATLSYPLVIKRNG